MTAVISEAQFLERLHEIAGTSAKSVTGPGRSGAIASVYASHYLGIPWIPFGQPCPDEIRPLLIMDTARKSGRTLRKAERQYGPDCFSHALFEEPPRVTFWYEVKS